MYQWSISPVGVGVYDGENGEVRLFSDPFCFPVHVGVKTAFIGDSEPEGKKMVDLLA